MRILFFGDIVGRFGLEAVSEIIDALKEKTGASFVIANGENVSKGRGITENDYHALLNIGVDVITLGNHWRDKNQIDSFINHAPYLIRPANLLGDAPGQGYLLMEVGRIKIMVINVLCKAFMKEEVSEPLDSIADILKENKANITIVDVHGESTSEKAILAYAFDGAVSSFIGTHTHVQTGDERICPGGTSFISDAGMCGANNSIIGFDPETTVRKMAFGEDISLKVADEGEKMVNAVLLDIDEETGLTNSIKRIYYINGKAKNGQNDF